MEEQVQEVGVVSDAQSVHRIVHIHNYVDIIMVSVPG